MHSPNLEVLENIATKHSYASYENELLRSIGLLKQLKTLHLDNYTLSPLDVIVEKGLPIKNLYVREDPANFIVDLENLRQITTLKTLKIGNVCGGNLVKLVQNLENLINLEVFPETKFDSLEMDRVLEVDQSHIDAIATILEKRPIRLNVTLYGPTRIPVSLRSLFSASWLPYLHIVGYPN